MEDQPRGHTEANEVCEVYETDDGELVLYDERNPDAYLQSSCTVAVER